MTPGERRAHWENVYRTRAATAVSWFQQEPAMSLRMIEAAGLPLDARIVDIGGGASLLVDRLLLAGFSDLTIVDVSEAALALVANRLGLRAAAFGLVRADIVHDPLPGRIDLWHDRAVFHFLTDGAERHAYAECLRRSLAPGGQAIIATFAADGPMRCSGLDTRRYAASELQAEFDFLQLVEAVEETHTTPTGGVQEFLYVRFSMPAA